MRPRLYLDEDSARHALAQQLRFRGADVISAVEAAMTEKDDESQLQWAADHSRAIYSHNRGDFCQLHAQWLAENRQHSGIILSRQDLSLGEQMRRLLRLINRLSAQEMCNRLEFLSAWGSESS